VFGNPLDDGFRPPDFRGIVRAEELPFAFQALFAQAQPRPFMAAASFMKTLCEPIPLRVKNVDSEAGFRQFFFSMAPNAIRVFIREQSRQLGEKMLSGR
jgi:hypothetical protein